MTLLVTGGRGQLGRAVLASALRIGRPARAVGADELDVRDAACVERALATIRPTSVINCAAYTKVDLAETATAAAYAVNCDGAAVLARGCRSREIPLVHVSTDYVFNGEGTQPYREDDLIAPIGAYGASKAAGEREVHAAGGVVVRTSWLFGDGGPSFVHTIARLAREKQVLRVVADQRGRPTYAGNLADALIVIAARAAARDLLDPTYHYCCDGEVTWHGFATAIVDELRRITPLPIACERIDPITTAEYPTPARRPAYSVLNTSRITAIGITPPSWHDGMRRIILEAVSLGTSR